MSKGPTYTYLESQKEKRENGVEKRFEEINFSNLVKRKQHENHETQQDKYKGIHT